MNIKQRDWALLHDWARKSWPVAGTDWQDWQVLCYDSSINDYVMFSNYQELRAWAGY